MNEGVSALSADPAAVRASPSGSGLLRPLLEPWTLLALLVAGVVAAPVLAVFGNLASPRWDVWRHLADTLLGELALNTIALLAGVGLGTAALGSTLAWLVATREFPGRRFFDWALILPLAVPAYVIGFVFVAFFGFAGPVQSALRELSGGAVRLPEVRSYGGVVLVMTLVLYPYVYLLARSAFAELGGTLVDAARGLGCGPHQVFWRVGVPLARPAIATGLALALMEALADFGTVSIFGYRTFTTAIYRVWFGMFDRVAAGQLAAVLMLFAGALIVLERRGRGRARYGQKYAVFRPRALPRLRGFRAWSATGFCALVLFSGFGLPAAVLVKWTLGAASVAGIPAHFPELVLHTISLAAAASVAALAAALGLAYGLRLAPSKLLRGAARLATLGYAVPGSVIAVGVLVILTRTDALLAAIGGGETAGLVLRGSVVGLVFAYLVRFISVAFFSVESGLTRISRAQEESARSLGASPRRVLAEVHFPLLRGSLITAVILVFVEVMKEMPATMLIRPFGMDTLAVEVWQRTTESLWHEAALPSLAIVAVGILPVIIITHLRSPLSGADRGV